MAPGTDIENSGSISPAILYILGIMRRSPWEAVNVGRARTCGKASVNCAGSSCLGLELGDPDSFFPKMFLSAMGRPFINHFRALWRTV